MDSIIRYKLSLSSDPKSVIDLTYTIKGPIPPFDTVECPDAIDYDDLVYERLFNPFCNKDICIFHIEFGSATQMKEAIECIFEENGIDDDAILEHMLEQLDDEEEAEPDTSDIVLPDPV
jgi:hypothetical protein